MGFSCCQFSRGTRKARFDFICLDNIKFVLLSFLQFNTETIFPKIWAEPLIKYAKGPLLFDLRRSKTSLLN